MVSLIAANTLNFNSEESVNALPKDMGFLRVLRFPPTGKVDRVGIRINTIMKVISHLL
jgi:hypothetical protein